MIQKQIFTIPANFLKIANLKPFCENVLNPHMASLGFELVPSVPLSNLWKHADSGLYFQIRGVYENNIAYSTGYTLNQGGTSITSFIIKDRMVYFKSQNIATGTGILQLISCNNGNGNLWFTFNGYNQIDNITEGVVFISGDRGINTVNGNVYEKSTSVIGVVKPIMVDYDALPDKVHISDTYITDGNFLVEKFPCMKGYASAEMQQYRIYEINGKRYLALPNRLLLEC